jgi:hypothetical protein
METKIDIELQKKLADLVGRDKAKEVKNLLMQYGVDVVTGLGSIDVDLPGLKIVGLASDGSLARNHPIRQHQFVCEVNGKSLVNLQKVELDPFDYNSGELFQAKITLIPGLSEESIKPIIKGDN